NSDRNRPELKVRSKLALFAPRPDAVLHWRRALYALAEFLAGAGQDGADAVDGHVQLRADFLVAAAFEVKQADDLALLARQLVEQAVYFFQRFEAVFGLGRFLGLGGGRVPLAVGFDSCFAREGAAAGQFLDADAAGYDGQIR